MSSALVDAKALCNDQILDVLNNPMFTIFQIQHDQIADRVDSDNKLLYHFKQSMSKMSEWNSSVVHDFCTKLVKRFPEIKKCEVLAAEMISLTCKIMNEAHASEGRYIPVDFSFHDVLHSFIVECSKVFIGHPEWFSHGVDSTEYQTCLSNARIAMKNREIVHNATRKYVTLTMLPASSLSSSAPSSPSSRSSSQPLSSPSRAFAGTAPTSASGIYLTPGGGGSGSGGGSLSSLGDDSGNDGNTGDTDDIGDHLEVSKNINVVTGDVQTIAAPKPAPTPTPTPVQNTLFPGSANSSSVYPSLHDSAGVSVPPPPNPFVSYPAGANVFSLPFVGQVPKTDDDDDDDDDDEDDDENSDGEHDDDEDDEDDEDDDEDDDDDGYFDDDNEGPVRTKEVAVVLNDVHDGAGSASVSESDSSDESESESDSELSDFESASDDSDDSYDSDDSDDSDDFYDSDDSDCSDDSYDSYDSDDSSDSDDSYDSDDSGISYDSDDADDSNESDESESDDSDESEYETEYATGSDGGSSMDLESSGEEC